jgi:tetratricopeptide (TPR) repeat protein
MNYKSFVMALVSATLILGLTACSTPEEKAQKFYEKGMSLLEKDPFKAKLEFQNALQMKSNMTPALYGLALVAEKQADWKACFGLLKKVLEEDPKHIDAMVKIGQIYLAAGEVDSAKMQADNAIALDPENLGAVMLQAALDLRAAKYEAAVEKANLVLKKDANNTDAYTVLASERHAKHDIQGALAFVNQALAINSKNKAMHLFKISLLGESGDIASTTKAWQDALQVFPDDYSFRGQFSEFLYKSGNNDEAESQLRYVVDHQAAEIQPKLTLIQFLLQTKGPQVARSEMEKMLEQNPEDFELRFYLVDFYESQGDTKAAGAQLKTLMDYAGNKPEGLKAKTKVATRFLVQNKKSDAVNLINQVLKVDSHNVDALILKSGISIDEMKYDEAILDLRAVIGEKPDSAQALYLLARAYELKGSEALAEESYVKALEASKYSPQYAIKYAESLIKKKENERAEKVLNDALRRAPKNVAITKLLAQIRLDNGDVDGAQMIADNIKGATNSNLSDLIEGAILLRKNDDQGAVAAFERAHQKAPTDMQAIMAVTKTHIGNKQFASAESFLKSVLETQPNNYDVKLLLAQVYDMAGNKQALYQELESAVALSPQNPIAYEQLASVYLREKNIEGAKSIIKKGLAKLPDNFDLNMALAEVDQNNQDYASAIATYKRLLKVNPNAIVALNNYVSVLADYETNKGELEQAYQDAQKLKGTNVAQFLDTYGWISFRVGKNDEAIQYLKLAIEKEPLYPVFYYHLGKVYLVQQNKGEARKSFEKALELSKNKNQDYVSEIKTLLKSI